MTTQAEELGGDQVQDWSLGRVIRFIIVTLVRLKQERAYAAVKLVIQKGRVEFVHVDRIYRPDTLPVQPGSESQTRKENLPA